MDVVGVRMENSKKRKAIFTPEDEIPLSRLASRMQLASCQVEAADFAAIDSDLIATETRSADDIVSELSAGTASGSTDEDTDDEILRVPTYGQSTSAIELLRYSLECEKETPHEFFAQLNAMRGFLGKCKENKLQQKRVTDFFKVK